MTDVASILGLGKNQQPPHLVGAAASASANSTAAAAANNNNNNNNNNSNNNQQPPPPPAEPSRAMKLQGMPREVMHLLSGGKQKQQDLNSVELPTMVPTFTGIGAAGAGGMIGVSSGILATKNQEGAVKVGNKWIAKNKPARKWTWAPFSSSSRTDGALFHHWVRANVEYPDYPYARFDIHLDPVTYSDDEYKRLLESETWTKSETDQLMEIAKQFELRWPIIHDRWTELFYTGQKARKVEDLQHRYYTVAAKLMQSRISQEAAAEVQSLVASAPAAAAAAAAAAGVAGVATDHHQDPEAAAAEGLLMETAAARALASCEPDHQPLIHNLGSGTSNKTFDLEYERERRAHLEALWNRSKADELEEMVLRKELKQVTMQLRKLKKSGGHIIAATQQQGGGGNKGTSVAVNAAASSIGSIAAAAVVPSAASSRNPSRSVSPAVIPHAVSAEATAASLDQAFASIAPVAAAQNPYLQSGRLALPTITNAASSGGVVPTPSSLSAGGGGGGGVINKSLLIRMEALLEELKIPAKITPCTKRACDLYDSVRKDVLTLLILQKNAVQKEGLLQSKRLRLAKMGGDIRVVDEETLLGIAPPPPPPAVPLPSPLAASAATGTGRSKSKGAGKAKATPSAAAASSSSSAAGLAAKAAPTAKAKPDGATTSSSAIAAAAAKAATATTVKEAPPGGKQPRKASTKRKRNKSETTSKYPAPPSVVAATATATATTVVSSSAAAIASAAPTTTAISITNKADEGKHAKKRVRKSS